MTSPNLPNPDVLRAAEDPYVRHVAAHIERLWQIDLEPDTDGNLRRTDPAKHDIKGIRAWEEEVEAHLRENGKWSTYNPRRGFMNEVIDSATVQQASEQIVGHEK